MIGVVIPAHNEEALLAACLSAVREAAMHPGLAGELVRVAVVLDGCTDFSGAIAHGFGVAGKRRHPGAVDEEMVLGYAELAQEGMHGSSPCG